MYLIGNAKINLVLVGKTSIIVVILALSTISAKAIAIAAEPIPDTELATLYGGWFYNPCCVSGTDCPDQTGYVDNADNCCLCTTKQGRRCEDDWSWLPDFDDCRTGSATCPAGCVRGYCGPEGTCNRGDLGGVFPNCNGGNYSTCDD